MNKIAILAIGLCACIFTTTAKADDSDAEKYAHLYPTQTRFYVFQGKPFSVTLNLDNTIIPSSFQWYIGLPEGITVAKKKLKYDITYTDRLDPDVYSLNAMQVEGTNNIIIVDYNNLEYNNEEGGEYKIQPGTGAFATIIFNVASDMTPGRYEVRLYDILFVTLVENKYASPDATIYVTVADPVTDLDITEADPAGAADVPYYDLMGRRVDNPTHGLYIRNGHKVIVK